MRKQGVRTFIQFSVLWVLLVLMFVTYAQAQGVEYDTTDNVLRVSCDQCISENEYVLLLLRKDAEYLPLNPEDIYFIDQMEASTDGKIEAVFVEPAFNECMILLGGDFADGVSPRILGDFVPGVSNTLTAPEMLQVIEAEAFMGATFTHVYLGENVTRLDSKAFADCKNLRYIYIPDSTTYIADDVFNGCNGFTIGCRDGSYAKTYAISNGFSYRLVD